MNMGDFGNFNHWSTKDKVLGKMVYDEAHKKSSRPVGGNKNNAGCLSVIVFIVAVGTFLLTATRL